MFSPMIGPSLPFELGGGYLMPVVEENWRARAACQGFGGLEADTHRDEAEYGQQYARSRSRLRVAAIGN